jgi:hypothetical protein
LAEPAVERPAGDVDRPGSDLDRDTGGEQHDEIVRTLGGQLRWASRHRRILSTERIAPTFFRSEATAVGVVLGSWLTERRERKRRSADIIAGLRVLRDAKPRPLIFSAGLVDPDEPARAKRHGEWLWGQWREVRQPLLAFAYSDSSLAVRKAGEEVATHVALSIDATRHAVDRAGEPGMHTDTRAQHEKERLQNAEQAYEHACEAVDSLEGALAQSFRSPLRR